MDTKFHQVANSNRNRHNNSWKIHLPKNPGIAPKGIGSTGKTGGEIVPGGDAREVKKKWWNAASAYTAQIIKYQGKNNGSKQRLDKIPQRPQNSLLIYRGNISFYKKNKEITITPNFF